MPVNKLMIQMGIPMILSMALQAVYNIVDSAFVGNMKTGSEAALNALTLVFPVQMLMVAVGIGTGVGTNALLARTLGQGNSKKAAKVAGNSLFLGVIIYVVCLLFGIFGAKAYISSQTVDAEVLEMGVSYLRICCVISFGIIFFSLFEKLLQATGRSLYSTIGQVVGAVVNIILDPIMIYGIGPVPEMGVKGAALATVLSQAVSTIWVIFFLCGKKTHLHLRKKYMRLEPKVFVPCVTLGLAAFIMQASESIVTVCFNSSLLRYGGDIAVGAMTILTSVMQFAMLPLQGIAQGAQPISSYNYGAKNTNRVKKTFRLLLMTCLSYSALLWAAVQLIPRVFVSIFTADASLINFTAPMLRIYLGGLFLFGIQIACQMTFTSLGKAVNSIVVAVVRKFVLLLPLIYIMPHVVSNPTTGVYMAEPIADIIAVLFTSVLFSFQFKKALAEIQNENN